MQCPRYSVCVAQKSHLSHFCSTPLPASPRCRAGRCPDSGLQGDVCSDGDGTTKWGFFPLLQVLSVSDLADALSPFSSCISSSFCFKAKQWLGLLENVGVRNKCNLYFCCCFLF